MSISKIATMLCYKDERTANKPIVYYAKTVQSLILPFNKFGNECISTGYLKCADCRPTAFDKVCQRICHSSTDFTRLWGNVWGKKKLKGLKGNDR